MGVTFKKKNSTEHVNVIKRVLLRYSFAYTYVTRSHNATRCCYAAILTVQTVVYFTVQTSAQLFFYPCLYSFIVFVLV